MMNVINMMKSKFLYDLIFRSVSNTIHINKFLSGQVNVSQTGSNTGNKLFENQSLFIQVNTHYFHI